MMQIKKAIYAEDLLAAIRDDPSINGAHFARVRGHIEAAPEILIKNKPRFIVKPKKVSREELIALQNCPVIFHTEDEHIVPICQDRWIPVTERLPEQYHSVIVWTSDKELGEAAHDGEHFCWTADDEYANVTHWMPLPQPPKEE